VSESESPQAEGTRGKLLALLCGANRTTSELARELGITANGARWHLERLEEEGLVERRVVRRGVGKPAHEYRLTAEGSLRLSRAYLPVLSGLLSLMVERYGPEEEAALLREVGRVLARQRPRPEGALRERAEMALGLLAEMGGSSTVREEKGALWIEGACCPLGALVPDHPLACKAVESLVEEYIGATVREQCEKGDPPTCRLLIGAAHR
jgi:DeoR family suf operon transcriptional repressor